jgi:hypothetical protein
MKPDVLKDDSGVVFFAYRCLEKIRILRYSELIYPIDML